MPVDKKTGKPFFIHPMLGRIEGFKNQKDFDKAVKTYNKKQGVKPLKKKKGGLTEWFNQKWVDIGSKRADGSFAPCGRSKQKADAKRKYPKCVPLAKARRMTEGQIKSAVKRKRARAQGVGGKPTNVSTFTKKYYGGMIDIN